MKVKRISGILIACIGGLALGFALRRSSDDTKAKVVPEPVRDTATVMSPGSDATVEDLLKVRGAELEEKLPLWLEGASSADMGKLWSAWCERGLPDPWHANLLFARWLEVNPKDATAKAGADGRACLAWVRAMRDPESALAELGKYPERDAAAVSALCEFHPDVALKALASRPGLATPAVVRRIAIHQVENRDPKAALNLLRRHYAGDLPVAMRAWTRDNPETALEWLKAQPGGAMQDADLIHFTSALADTDLGRLAELAARQPQGRIRREMERAVFLKTLATAPAAALLLAQRNESPRIAAEWLAEIGKRQLAADTGRAFTTFGEVLAACPDAMRIHDRVANANGFGTESFTVPGVRDFATALLEIDAARTLDIALDNHGKFPGRHRNPWHASLDDLAEIWAALDLDGLSQWVARQPEGPVHDGAAGLLAWTYAHRGNFSEAMRWALSIRDEESLASRVGEVADKWARHDWKALEKWMETAELPDPLKSIVHGSLKENER